MTTTTAKKPRPARRRKPKAKTMTSETYQVSNKVSDTQLPVIITEQRRKLTELTPQQAAYINVPPQGPYKPNHYRY